MIRVKQHKYKNAIRFKEQNGDDIWLIFGGTSAWPNEADPPDATNTTTAVAEAFGAQKASITWVVEDPGVGTIEVVDSEGATRQFSILATAEDVLTAGSGLVMLEATALGTDLAVPAFRIMGFATGIVPGAGFEANTYLSAAQIDDWGTLETLENRKPFTVIEESTFTLREFLNF